LLVWYVDGGELV